MKNKRLFFIILISAILSLAIIPATIQAAPDEGALIKGLSNKVYVIENGLKRWIETANIFNKLKYSWTNIKIISETLLNDIPSGRDITNSYKYPDGTLLKGSNAPVYFVEKEALRWIPNPQIFTAMGFKWQNIIQISDKTLNRIKKDEDISLNPQNHRPQTFILDGPCKQYQTTIPEIKTNQIEFRYSGKNSQGNLINLKFETFLAGYDKNWESSWSSYGRKITLPERNKTYTFYVRAKTEDGYYDITPASCKFKVNLSSYYQQVEISSVRGKNSDPAKEQITLKVRRSFSENINITGWTLSTKKDRIIIPQAVKIVHPESMYNFKKDLILEANEKITIHGGSSPIEINAYKLNTCEKYLDNQDEYKTCFYENNQYPDFLKNEWEIYLNRTSEFLTNKNEEIILRDENNKIVDKYSY